MGFVEALTLPVRASVELTGGLESRRQSLVASEVSGLVVELERREGETARRGQPLARLRRTVAELRLRAAEGDLEEARALLELARTNRQRAQQLFEEKVFSQAQLDDALSQYDANQGRVARLEAETARLADELDRTVVRAPFDGVVVAEHTAVGEWIDAGDPVVEMVDMASLEIALEVPEQYFAGLAAGEPVTVVVPALGGEELTGKVRAVVPKADARARTFPLKVAVSDPDGRLGVGMLARVRLPVGAPRESVVVPKDAVVTQGSGRFVFRLDADDRAEQVAVRVGDGVGEWVAVSGGVAAGDRVVVQGNERLQPGQAVTPQRHEVPRP